MSGIKVLICLLCRRYRTANCTTRCSQFLKDTLQIGISNGAGCDCCVWPFALVYIRVGVNNAYFCNEKAGLVYIEATTLKSPTGYLLILLITI
jgi:predicted metal-binding membrane protein